VGAALANHGFEIKARKELRCSKGQLPFGFRVVHGNLVPHRGEKEILNQMIHLRKTGASYGVVADWLNSSKIPTKNKSKKWDRPTVFKILGRHAATNSVGPQQ